MEEKNPRFVCLNKYYRTDEMRRAENLICVREVKNLIENGS
jgi:hypothetical protein